MPRGRLYIRLEHEEWEFVRELGDAVPFDAAVVRDDYLAPYPKGHRRYGEEAAQLIDALDAVGVRWSLDPNTAQLEHENSGKRLRPRAAGSLLAKALPLPLSPSDLTSEAAQEILVDAAATVQLRSQGFASPYLEVGRVDDPRIKINADLIKRSVERAGDRAVVAYLQTMARFLRDGSAVEVAKHLHDAGAQVIFIRIRRLDPEQASIDDTLAYADLVQRIARAGSRAVPDCIGRLGPVLVAAGADGFSTNALHFRKVPDVLLVSGGGGGSRPLQYEVPGRWHAVPLDRPASNLPPCAVADCEAEDGQGNENAIRVHNLHELRRLARLAAAEGVAFAEHLRAAGSPYASGWAEALERLALQAA